MCIKLHDNNFRPVVWLWKPFHRYFVHFRRRWDSTASIINAFTTFLLLSFSKILFVSLSLFCSSYIRYNFDFPQKCVLYYDPTVECYTQEFIMVAAIGSCTPQTCSESVSHVVGFAGGMLCTCLWNHFRDSTRMEPIILVTSGWFLHHFSSSGYGY